MIKISVIICTYNPKSLLLNRTLEGLKRQTLDRFHWELIIIDNNSTNNILSELDLSWHPNLSVFKEEKQGLTFARLSGFQLASGPFVVMVDDDNELDERYLENALSIFEENETLGALGGKSLPIYLSKPPEYIDHLWNALALRDLGDLPIVSDFRKSDFVLKEYPKYSPIGAGMVLRKTAIELYMESTKKGQILSDRQGDSLTSGGDCDIVINVIKAGWNIGYHPGLVLHHIIPSFRLTKHYLGKISQDSYVSWVALLSKHQLESISVIGNSNYLIRKLWAWLRLRPWKSDLHYINYKTRLGQLKGLNQLHRR